MTRTDVAMEAGADKGEVAGSIPASPTVRVRESQRTAGRPFLPWSVPLGGPAVGRDPATNFLAGVPFGAAPPLDL